VVKLTDLSSILLFVGSSVTLFVGLLAAFVPGLAYVTVHKFWLDVPNPPYGLPYVVYQPLEFTAHIYTARYFVSAVGGLTGLFALFGKSKQSYVGVIAIAVANLGLMLPASSRITPFMDRTILDVPWTGSFLVLVGVCLMFLGLTLPKTNVPRVTFLSVPLLLAGYSIPPFLVLTNNLQVSGFTAGFTSPISSLMLFLIVAGYLFIVWGILRIFYPKNKDDHTTVK
jgi:hypothetical protein